MTQEDIKLIVEWFAHIEQMADDRKTANGVVMEDWAALDEIKCLARECQEYINLYCTESFKKEVTMDYKDKLRLAKEALDSGSYDKETIEYIFPELKESEDERIRKRIVALVDAHGQGKYKDDMLAWLEKQGEQKSVDPNDKWIEDYWVHNKVNNPDSYNCGDEIQFDHGGFVRFCKQFQKPAEWSEEDEIMLNSIIATCQMYEQTVDSNPAKHLLKMQENWLKSLRPQNHWKPSEEQMKALCSKLPVVKGGGDKVQDILESLYDDLKNYFSI